MESPSTAASGIVRPPSQTSWSLDRPTVIPGLQQVKAERTLTAGRALGPTARSGGAVAVAPLGLRDVAVGDLDEHVVALAPAAREVLGDGHRAVAPAGAADGDREVRLALGDVLGQQVVQERLPGALGKPPAPPAPPAVHPPPVV